MTNTNSNGKIVNMLSYGGVQFASSIFLAFLAYYPLVLLTDVALIPPAIAGLLLSGLRLFSAAGDQAIGIYINRASIKGGKYRPWFRRCAIPHAVCLAAVGLTPGFGLGGKIIFAAITLALCELFRSIINMAAMSMLPYMADTDEERTKYVSFSTAASIGAFFIVGTFMMPLVGLLGGGFSRVVGGTWSGGIDGQRAGFALLFALLAIVSVPMCLNAYHRLSEGSYDATLVKQPIAKMYAAIIKNKRLVLFFAGYCLFATADAFRNLTAYYYVANNLGRPEFISFVIMAGVITPFAMQPIIPRLLAFAKKETCIIFGLFAASALNFILPAISGGAAALLVCAVLYGSFTALSVNLVYAMVATFADEMRARHEMQMSDVLSAILSLSYKVGMAIAGGAAPIIMAMYGYSAENAMQPASALSSIKALYFSFTAIGMALSGAAMLFAIHQKRQKA
ncbi:MAG: MFS transporter [Oscillospiraceae bacterium]|nr:MFS transporter [Oscillospiraceae bacterium]